jgi:nitrite reductase/ring-hydroxylating ferredoxin subunit
MHYFRWVTSENTVTCPFYGAKFDVTNGKKLSEPILTPSQEMEPLPQTSKIF